MISGIRFGVTPASLSISLGIEQEEFMSNLMEQLSAGWR